MEIRIDKWLWTMRLFKTRSLATEECKKGRILINKLPVKPSRMVKELEIVEVKIPPAIYSYRILKISNNRLNAKLIHEFIENITTPEQLEIIELNKIANNLGRKRGSGRPTKKERRDIDDFTDPYHYEDD